MMKTAAVKKFCKRIAALAVAAAICVPFAAFAEETGVPTTINTEDFELLQGLGMTDASFDMLLAEDDMTRAQFVSVLARLVGFDEYIMSDKNRFADVAAGSTYEQQIYYLKNLGVINGIDEYRFAPDVPITLGEACTAAVKALGGGYMAENHYGGYPSGYLTLARKADIIKAGTAEDKLTVEEGVRFLKNTALALVWVESISAGDAEYKTEKDRTLIAEYCDILSGEGIMTDNGITALSSVSAVGEDYVVIDGIKLSSDGEFSDKIGLYTEFWYKDNYEELVFAREKKNKNQILTVEAGLLCGDAEDFSTEKLLYYKDYDSSKRENAKISADADMIYNGRAYPEFDAQTLRIKSGTLTLISNDGDKTYDLIIAREHENSIVQNTDEKNLRIYGANGVCLQLGDYDNAAILSENGEAKTIADIHADSVLSYMISKDGECIEIRIVSKAVTAKIVSVDKDISDFYESEQGDKYRPAYSLLEDIANGIAGAEIPEIGETYLFRLDIDGRAVTSQKQQINVWRYAYYIGMRPQENPEDGPWLKLIMSDGSVYIAYPAKRLTVNGERQDAEELLYNSLLGMKRQVVRIRMNADGDISGIETASQTTGSYGFNGNEFSKDATLLSAKYYGNNTLIMGKYAISRDAVIFEDPDKNLVSTDFDVDDIKTYRTSQLKDGTRYSSIDIYDADETLCAAAVVYEKRESSFATTLLTVDKVINYIDEYDEPAKKLTGVANGVHVEYTEYEDGVFPDGLKRGDVARIELEGTKIRALDKMISLADHPKPTVQPKIGGGLNETEWVNMFGTVYAKSDNAVSVYLGTENAFGPLQTISLNGGAGIKVTIYDDSEGTVTPGSLADIVPGGTVSKSGSFTTNGDTMIFIYRRHENLREAVVVKY